MRLLDRGKQFTNRPYEDTVRKSEKRHISRVFDSFENEIITCTTTSGSILKRVTDTYLTLDQPQCEFKTMRFLQVDADDVVEVDRSNKKCTALDEKQVMSSSPAIDVSSLRFSSININKFRRRGKICSSGCVHC